MTDALHAVLRPKRSRFVALGVAATVILAFLGLIVALGSGLGWADRIGFAALAGAVAWFLWRLASVRAVPGEHGLHVRNLLVERDLSWAEIVSVRFGGGNPWVLLDLDDGETLPVMAVQRSDGERAVAESRRLATLVAFHSRTERDD